MQTSHAGSLREVKEFNIRCFGATGNGVTKDTEALQSAIDQCHAQGGGRVVVPAGRYLTNPFRLRSFVELHLEKDAVILGSPDAADYSEWEPAEMVRRGVYNNRYLIIAEAEEKIAITGPGCIDGQGRYHYEFEEEGAGKWWKIVDKATRPGRMIWFLSCRDVRMEEAHLIGSPAWTVWLLDCQNVRIEGITIRADLEAINTDGIDIESCRDVFISHCDIRTGDDCIVFRANERWFADLRPCENVRVENCVLLSRCQGVRFSYWPDGVVRNVSMNNIRIIGSTRGVICQVPLPLNTPERWADQPYPKELVVENISFTNFTIEANQPIWWMLDDSWVAHRIGNITFENVTIEGSIPSLFKGNAGMALDNLTLRNIRYKLKKRETLPEVVPTAEAMIFQDCENVVVTNFIAEGDGNFGKPVFAFERVEGVSLEGVTNRTPLPVR